MVDKDSLYAKAYYAICLKHGFYEIYTPQIDGIYYVFGNKPKGDYRSCIFVKADSSSSRWSDYVYFDKSNGKLTGPKIVEKLFKMAKDYDIRTIVAAPMSKMLNGIQVIKKGSTVEEFLIDDDMRADSTIERDRR